MKKYRIFCAMFGSMILFMIYVSWEELSLKLPMELTALFSTNQLFCYWSKSNGIEELGQGEWDEQMLIPSRCIFFHDTTCSTLNLTPRQACAVESAAKTNRMLNIFLLFLSNAHFFERSQELINILKTYDNVYIRRIRLSMYVIDTPIEDWLSKNIKNFSENQEWLRKDFHDYIRILTLWKFGGIALNLDSIVQTSLDELTTFVGVQNDRNREVGVFGVDTSTNFGRKFVNTCIKVIKDTNADNYSRYNITRVITEALGKLCYQQNTSDRECRQFTIYPPEKFYPISLHSWKDYFNESKTEEVMKMIKHAATIHSWNDYSRNIKVDNVAAYITVAKQNCPKIYEHFASVF